MADLSSCPFCGDKHPHIEVVKAHSHGPIASFMPDHPGSAFISCTSCEAMMTEISEEAVIAAWNCRARTAYDAIGSRVKADSGWVEWAGGETPVEPGTEGLIRVEDGEFIYTTKLGSFNFAHDRSGPFPGRRIVAYRVLSCLSTHTAAGAGPVGEAVAWTENANALLELNEKGALTHPVPGLAVSLLRKAIDLLADRPVDEPGEVERDDVSGCEMNVGCIETGICYAKAQGEPDRCARPADVPGHFEWLNIQVTLMPFAKAATLIERNYGVDVPDSQIQNVEVTMADLRAARAAIAFLADKPEAPSLEAPLRNLVKEMRHMLRANPQKDGGLYRQRLAEAEAALTGDAQEAGR